MKDILGCSYGELEREFVSIYDEIKDVDRSQIEKVRDDIQIMTKAVLAFKIFGDKDVKRAVNVFKRSIFWGRIEDLDKTLEKFLPEVTLKYVGKHAPTLLLGAPWGFYQSEKQFLLGYLGIGIAPVMGKQYYIIDVNTFNNRLEEIDEVKEYLFKAEIYFSNEYVVKAKSKSEAVIRIGQYFSDRACARVEVNRDVSPSIILKSEATNGKVRFTGDSSGVCGKLVRG